MAELPPALRTAPRLDRWVRIDPEGTISLFTGKVELGQGIAAALARIGADELDVALESVRIEPVDTDRSPDEGFTAGSQSLQTSGTALRLAAAQARRLLLDRAAERLAAPVAELTVAGGVVTARSGAKVSYWELQAGEPFGCDVTGEAPPKPASSHALVGAAGTRPDVVGLVTGTTQFVQDLSPPGMLHARVVRPAGPLAQLLDLDETAARALPGVVAIVRDGSFVAVVAEREEQAVRARELLRSRARWADPPPLPATGDLPRSLLDAPLESRRVVDGAPVEGPLGEPVDLGAHGAAVDAVYTRPFLLHGSLGPSAALAEWRDGRLVVHAASQGVFPLRAALAAAFGLVPEDVRVVYVPGSGCYGHNGVDDAALDAALVARALPGRPVLLKWMREDEHGWEPLGPAMVVRSAGAVDGGGRIRAFEHETWSPTHMARPEPETGAAALLASQQWARPLEPPQPRLRMFPHAGIHRNADPIYAAPTRRVLKHLVVRSPFRVSSLRGLGAYLNVVGIESTIDELAALAASDPVDFRLAHLDDPRARAVVRAAAERFGWERAPQEFGTGRGIGFARYKNAAAYAAVAVEVTVDDDTAAVRVERAVAAADAGEVVDPDGLVSQLEGGIVQSTSWTLVEQVRHEGGRIASLDGDGYPVLRFPDVPAVDVVLLDRPGEPFLGAGEATQGPTAAAIVNAVAAAIGVRVRDLPLTPERIRAAVAGG